MKKLPVRNLQFQARGSLGNTGQRDGRLEMMQNFDDQSLNPGTLLHRE
jgi:hypothetical protein